MGGSDAGPRPKDNKTAGQRDNGTTGHDATVDREGKLRTQIASSTRGTLAQPPNESPGGCEKMVHWVGEVGGILVQDA